jgi:hypothetical protein
VDEWTALPRRSVLVVAVFFVNVFHATGAFLTRPLPAVVALHSQWVALVIYRV